MEAIWVVAEMRAGGAYAHSILALHALGEGAAIAHWALCPRTPTDSTRHGRDENGLSQ